MGRVLFQHIPQAHEESDIDLARDLTIAFIEAFAEDPLIVGR
jgi:hypothetical protein